MRYNIIDLFCGTGGFAHGFVSYSHKFKIVCAIDILEHAAKTTRANHEDCLVIQDDIRNVKPSTLKKQLATKNIDVIIGGPPCQGFSSIRPFRSSAKDDPRNSLFEQFALYVNYFKPQFFVLENVVGLLTYANGETLRSIRECFNRMKYKTEWKILNAANFGVPQKRERFILIGARDGGNITFPQPTHSFSGKSIGYKDKTKMLGGEETLLPPISVIEAIGDLPTLKAGQKADRYDKKPENCYQAERRKRLTTLTLHEAPNHSPKILEIIRHAGSSIRCIPKHLITSGFSSCYSRIEPKEPATTLTVKFQSAASNKCIHPYQDRALTAREGARLQGFDDDYLFCGSKTDIVTQIGNAVPPLLGKAIAKCIYHKLEHSSSIQITSPTNRSQKVKVSDYELV
jgi:DNA (cytosine-5)-methyltransferase 1